MVKIKCLKFKEIQAGALLGFADIQVLDWGIQISDVKVFLKNGTKWIGLPSKMIEQNGEKKYFPYIKFLSKDASDNFSKDAVIAIDFFMQQTTTGMTNATSGTFGTFGTMDNSGTDPFMQSQFNNEKSQFLNPQSQFNQKKQTFFEEIPF